MVVPVVRHAALALGALALQACLNSSTYGDVDLGGSSIDISSVNLAADGNDAAVITLWLRSGQGAAFAGGQAQIAIDHGNASAPAPTDAAGRTRLQVTSTEVGQHTLSVQIVLPNGQVQPIGLSQVLNFYTPNSGGVPVAVPLNAQAAVHGTQGELMTRYTGTVHFVSDDPNASLPADYTFTGAERGFKIWLGGIVLRTAGSHFVDAVDRSTGEVLTHQVFAARAGGAALLQAQAWPQSAQAGARFAVHMAASDSFGNPVAVDTGMLTFQSSDPTATWEPAPAQAAGSVQGMLTLTHAGTQLVQWSSADLGTGWLGVAVAASAAASLEVSAPGTTIAGSAVSLQLRALDAYGNTVTSCADALQVASSDPQAVLGTAASLQQGVAQWTSAATLLAAGPQTLTVTAQPSGIAATVPLQVQPAAPVAVIAQAPAALVAGQGANLVLAVQDTFGNTVNTYAGTLALQSSDAQAQLPTQAVLSGGLATVPFSLRTMGAQSLSIRDPQGLLAGAQPNVAISPASASKVRITQVASPLRISQRSDVALAVLDAYGNPVPYQGTLHWTSSDAGATLPASVTLTGSENGVATLSQSLAFAHYGQQWLQVDDATGTVSGRLSPIAVHAITQVAMGTSSACAVLDGSLLKCWGANASGQLGLGDTTPRGLLPNQMGANLPTVSLGTGRIPTKVISGEGLHFCALLDNGQVKCWGDNSAGELGLGDTQSRGGKPGQMGDALPAVDLGTGRTAVDVQAGYYFSCALLDTAQVKCWGGGFYLGLEDPNYANIGDQPGEMGDNLPTVNFGTGRTVSSVWAKTQQASVILDDGTLKDWGGNWNGGLGVGDSSARGGPGTMGDNLPAVNLGTGRTARALAFGAVNECALLDDATVKCWGGDQGGGLGGQGWGTGTWPGSMGDNLPPVNLGTGRTATQLTMGYVQGCALLDNHAVKCWGANVDGELGLGDKIARGDNPGATMGDNLPALDLGTGRTVSWIGAGSYVTCVLLDSNQLKCWGFNGSGQLGLGDQVNRGDLPNQMGDNLPETVLW